MKSRLSKAETKRGGDTDRRHVVAITGNGLTIADVANVARNMTSVTLTTAGHARAAAAHRTVLDVGKRRPIYAQSTGVGSNKDTRVDGDSAVDHGMRLLESHAVGAGPLVPAELSRAMMTVRLNQLAAGGSGASPVLLDALAVALNKGLVPQLRRYGAIGTGDLSMLAETALCIAGCRPWRGGSMETYSFAREDAMAFMSSGAATLGEAALACEDISSRLYTGLLVAACTHLALGGSAEAYNERVHTARPHPGQIAAAEELRQLLGADLHRPARRIQDQYGLRALPQVQGAALDAAAQLQLVLEVEINASSENPLVSAEAKDVFHNGNFHSVYVGQALDGLRSALYSAAALSIARLGVLMSPDGTGLRPFLAEGPAASSGLLILEYVAHSALAELRHLSQPDSLSNAVLSHGTEEHASFTTQSAWHASQMVPVYEIILACELMAAVYALQQQTVVPGVMRLSEVYEAVVTRLAATISIDEQLAALIAYVHEVNGG